MVIQRNQPEVDLRIDHLYHYFKASCVIYPIKNTSEIRFFYKLKLYRIFSHIQNF